MGGGEAMWAIQAASGQLVRWRGSDVPFMSSCPFQVRRELASLEVIDDPGDGARIIAVVARVMGTRVTIEHAGDTLAVLVPAREHPRRATT